MELFIFYLKYKKSVLSSRIEYLPFLQHYVWDDSTDTERKKKKEKGKKNHLQETSTKFQRELSHAVRNLSPQ